LSKEGRPCEKDRDKDKQKEKEKDKYKDKDSSKEVRGKNIQCFKCLENVSCKEQDISLIEHSSSSSSEEDTQTSEEEIQPCFRKLLVVKRLLPGLNSKKSRVGLSVDAYSTAASNPTR